MGWDTFFEGVSAIATAGALAAAVAAGVQAKRLFKIESDRDAKAQRSDEQRQASHVSAWAAVRVGHRGIPSFGVIVRNSSQDPVYDVRVTGHGFSTRGTPQLWCVPPGEYFVENIDVEKPDGRVFHWDFAKTLREVRDPVRPFSASDNVAVDQITFRDNSGVSWKRTAKGELTMA